MATFAPYSAKRTAIAWPMPELPPVTRTFLPSSPGMALTRSDVVAVSDISVAPRVAGGQWSRRRAWRYSEGLRLAEPGRTSPPNGASRSVTPTRPAGRLRHDLRDPHSAARRRSRRPERSRRRPRHARRLRERRARHPRRLDRLALPPTLRLAGDLPPPARSRRRALVDPPARRVHRRAPLPA